MPALCDLFPSAFPFLSASIFENGLAAPLYSESEAVVTETQSRRGSGMQRLGPLLCDLCACAWLRLRLDVSQ